MTVDDESEINKLIDKGIVFDNEDGTFTLSDEAQKLLSDALDKDPTLFAQWFPDRLN